MEEFFKLLVKINFLEKISFNAIYDLFRMNCLWDYAKTAAANPVIEKIINTEDGSAWTKIRLTSPNITFQYIPASVKTKHFQYNDNENKITFNEQSNPYASSPLDIQQITVQLGIQKPENERIEYIQRIKDIQRDQVHFKLTRNEKTCELSANQTTDIRDFECPPPVPSESLISSAILENVATVCVACFLLCMAPKVYRQLQGIIREVRF